MRDAEDRAPVPKPAGATGESARKSLLVGACAVAALAAAAGAVRADPVEDFYRGRQVRLIIGSSSGGTYDSYGRLLAAHLGRHIPGSPAVVPANMPGASGIQSATYLYQIAPKDGTTIGLFNQSMSQRQMLEPEVARFDIGQFNWLGALTTTTSVFITWHGSGVMTLDDARKKDVVMGALSSDGGNSIYPLLLNKFLGTRFKVVLGYQGGNTIQLAMERGEVDGRASVVWSGLKAGWPQWIAEHKINVIVQIGLGKEPDLADVPLLIDLARSPAERSIFWFVSSDSAMGLPIVAPPGIGPERVAALRQALRETAADPDFLADAQMHGLPIRPVAGGDVQKIVDSVIATPKESIEDAKSDAKVRSP
jgi:tripartite-type tricarboxylate transporter receptor subunit TctC